MTFFEYLSSFFTFEGNTRLWHNKKDRLSTCNGARNITTSVPWLHYTTTSPRKR